MATLIHLLQDVLNSKDPLLPNEIRRILLKEALQALLLDYLYNHPQYRRLVFYGGSCLRVLFGLDRLSEDLDLDNQVGLDLSPLADDLTDYFKSRLAYPDLTVKEQTSQRGILRVTLKFPLLINLGLSQVPEEALHLKLEISSHVQVVQILQTPVFYHGRSFVPAHYSQETMMAAKMLACLERSFQKEKNAANIKGRDFYDLLWLMQRRVAPLEEKLQRDGQQTHTCQSAWQLLQARVVLIRPQDLAIDLLPLFESREYIQSWIYAFHPNFHRLVEVYLAGEIS